MSNCKTELLSRIEGKIATVGIIGLDHVGLPLAAEIIKAGHKTIGFNVQEQEVEQVNRTHNRVGNAVDGALEDVVKSGRLFVTSDFSFVSNVDCVAICVPTPLDRYQWFDISYVKGSTESVARYLHAGMLMTLESIIYPGTTEEFLKPILEESGFVCDEDFFLALPLEHVDPDNEQCKTKNTSKVVDGMGKDSTEVVAALYRDVLEGGVYEVASPAMAEMEKLPENTYRDINVGFANEMAIICNRVGISIWDVIDAAKTKSYGLQASYPSLSLGGHCIPLDPSYLTWKAREYDYHTWPTKTSDEINTAVSEYMVDRAMEVLNHSKTAMSGARVLILSVTYKNDTNDYRESPALSVIDHLPEQGANVVLFDPYIPEYKHKGDVHKGLTALTDDELKNADIVIICAAHKCSNYNRIQSLSKMIFDMRNAMKDTTDRSSIELL